MTTSQTRCADFRRRTARTATACSALAIAVALALPAVASAQAAAQAAAGTTTGATPGSTAAPAGVEDNTKLEEVVVTARKRTESIDTVPLAITAMTADKIEARNLKSIEDVAAFSPGFFTQSQTGTGAGRNDRSFRQLTFRGIGASSTNVGVLAGGVGFLDGAPVLNSSLSDVQDLERVEVLRGPQSVYFGRSTFIGAINYITKEPTNTWTSQASLEAGEDDLVDASAGVSGPIIPDMLSFRLSGRHFEKGGQWKTSNSGVELGGQGTDSISLSTLFTPLPDLKIRTFYNHFEDNDEPPAQYTLGGKTIGPGASNCNLGGTAGAYYCGEAPQTVNLANLTANVSITPALNDNLLRDVKGIPIPFDFSQYVDDYGLKRKADQFTNRIDYSFWGGYTLSSVTAIHSENVVTMADLGFKATALTYATSVGYKDNDWSQEIRLVSPQNQRLRWILGGNYVFLNNTTSGIIGQFGAFGVLNFGAAQIGYTRAKTPAVFGGLYFDVLPKLTFTFEGRYQEDELDGHYGTSATTFVNISQTFDSFSPRVSLDYKITPNSTIYGLFSEGYKPGGFNQGILTQPQFVLDQLASTGAAKVYDQEKLDNYELGIKGSFLQGRVRVALDGYIGRYTNAQIPLPVSPYTTQNANGTPNTSGPTNTFTLTRNVGEVDLQGVEFEGEAIVIPGLRVGATFAYTDTDIKAYFCNECSSIIAQNATNNIQVTSALGKRLPGAPKFSYTLSASYEKSLSNDIMGYVGVDYLYRGSYFAEAANIASSGDWENVNARLGLRKGRYNIELFVRNLFDDQSPSIAYGTFDATTGLTANALRIGLPDRRRVGVRLNAAF